MSATNVYGRVVTPDMVEEAIAETIKLWLPNDYLPEIERLRGYAPGEIERPQAIVTASEWARNPETPLPCLVVVNTGLAGQPERHAEGRYHASWLVGVSPIVSDVNDLETRRLAGAYIGAVRMLVLQHRMLKSALYPDGFASGLAWSDEKYTEIDFGRSRSLGSGLVAFSVGVDNVVTEGAGPRVPSETPSSDPGNWPEVEDVEVRIRPASLAEVLG